MNTGDGPFGPVVNGTQIVFFEYRPNEAAGYAFLALFGIAALVHLFFILQLRAWFCIALFLGGISETFGYYGRARASKDPSQVGPFIQQNLLILVAAPFLAASIYMSLGRLTVGLGAQRHSVISVRWMTKIYVLVDIGCIGSQFVGSIIPASGDPDAIKNSRIILIAGLIVQLSALSLFIFTCWHVHTRVKRNPPDMLLENPALQWEKYFWAVEGMTGLMLIRSMVRSIEYLQGEGGFVISHEVFIYLFDAVPMLLIMVILAVVHPGRLIRQVRGFKALQ
ncbi:RTA1-domain-containing protein [Camillea tinctor]|nr:RTA1-domain-containing protein [Camillea tinctor]